PCVIASHSANATAACLLTAYVAEPICDKSPAADAVCRKYPSPRDSIAGNTARAAYTCANTFTSQTRCHCSSGVSTPPGTMMPALEQKRSIDPYCAVDVSTSRITSASTATSVVTANPPVSCATAPAPSPSMSATTMPRAPSCLKRRHNAAPIPVAPPVTTTTLPWSFTFVPSQGSPKLTNRRPSSTSDVSSAA